MENDYFKRLRKMMTQSGGRKATAALEASKNPMKFIKDNKSMNIKGNKGAAF